MSEQSSQSQDPLYADKKAMPKLILLNLKLAIISYSLSFALILFLLIFSSQGTFAQVITASVSLIGLFVFTLAIIVTVIYYFISKKHGLLVGINRLAILKILLIWSPFLISSVFYALDSRQYGDTHRPDQATVISLIRDCKVTRVQDNGNGDVVIIETDEANANPSEGAIITHANINTLNAELKTVNHECTFVKRVYDSDTAITKWLKLDEATAMIKQCKVRSIQGYTQDDIQNVLSNVTLPPSTPTGILLEDWGHNQLLYIDQATLAKVDPVAQQYKKTCNNNYLVNYGL